MTDLNSLASGGDSSQSPRLAAMQRRRGKRATKGDEIGQSKEEELEQAPAEAEKKAESVSKARKKVEVSEAPARWLEIREALRKEKEIRSEMKKRMEMEEIMNPKKVSMPPPLLPGPKRRKRSSGASAAMVSGSSYTGSTTSMSSQSKYQLFNLHHPAPPPQALLQPLQTMQNTTLDDSQSLQSPPTSQVLTWCQDRPPRTLQLFPEAPLPDEPQPRDNVAVSREITSTWAPSIVRPVAVTRINGERLTGSLKRFPFIHELVICCDCHDRMFSPEGFLNHAGWTLLRGDDPPRYIVMLR